MALNPALVYDPRYAPQQLEIPTAQTDWKLWGNGIRAIDVFANEAIPMTENFDNWSDWAMALMGAVNPRMTA